MASIFERIQDETKDAMRARDTERATALRMLTSALKNKQIDLRRELTDEDAIDVLSTEAKKRREASEAYRTGGRDELADKEERELHLVEKYLPQQLTDAEASAIVAEAITESGAESRRDMGKVMAVVMPRLKGRYDGSKVKDLVMAKLD
ncbi:MAG: GatB/YqeY domain-containing protein [Bradymonadaceae bacterium]|nr:GatB/YqeY domain-containing protein [Lujinxingiaceae bacterium]